MNDNPSPFSILIFIRLEDGSLQVGADLLSCFLRSQHSLSLADRLWGRLLRSARAAFPSFSFDVSSRRSSRPIGSVAV